MEMDSKLRELGHFFRVFPSVLEKSLKSDFIYLSDLGEFRERKKGLSFTVFTTGR